MSDFRFARIIAKENYEKGREFTAPKYSGLGGTESDIWDSFLRTTSMKFKKIMYNTHLGPGGDVSEFAEEEIKKMWKAKTQLRVDAIGETQEKWWIFEVKPRFGRSAVGQLDSYAYYFEHRKPNQKPIKKACVCKRKDPNMLKIARSKKIKVIQV